jgi:hypothetical protein
MVRRFNIALIPFAWTAVGYGNEPEDGLRAERTLEAEQRLRARAKDKIP